KSGHVDVSIGRARTAVVKVRFWGVRGSIPWAATAAMAYGCNTPGIEGRREDQARLILDAGSGIVGLSDAIFKEARTVPILLTHYHWDHVQGLAFYAPMFDARRAPTIHAPALTDIGPRWL